MPDTKQDRNLGEAAGASRRGADKDETQTDKSRGTNRDFDESGESINQGHGHPREKRERRSED